ncbi:MAG TPA: DUF2809 domain-containing protein, partial [Streptomyces sp.]|nr:DUF2809 domain-containing protein [Streptomyces sp.]
MKVKQSGRSSIPPAVTVRAAAMAAAALTVA